MKQAFPFVLLLALGYGGSACASHGSGRFPAAIDAARRAPGSPEEAKALAAAFVEKGNDDDISVVLPIVDAAWRAHPDDLELQRARGRVLLTVARIDASMGRKAGSAKHNDEGLELLVRYLEKRPDLETFLAIDRLAGADATYRGRVSLLCQDVRRTIDKEEDVFRWLEGCLTAANTILLVGVDDGLSGSYVAKQTAVVQKYVPSATQADVLVYVKGRQNRGLQRKAEMGELMRTMESRSCRVSCFNEYNRCAAQGEYERPGRLCQEAQYECLRCCDGAAGRLDCWN
jgi:hypothetical protein